ncbi:MAG: hypothetical protein ABI197_14375, partial [Granulicella sp.]
GVGLNLELLDAIYRGHIDDSAPVRSRISDAIEQESGGAKEAPAEIEEGDVLVSGALRAAPRGFLLGGGVLDGGVEGGQAVDIAEVKWEFDHLLGADLGGQVGVIGVHQGGFPSDEHFLRAGTRGERDGQRGALAGNESDALLPEGFEGLGFDLQGVDRRRQKAEGIVAPGVGCEERSTPFCVLVRVTIAPEITAPVESWITPLSVATVVRSCADSGRLPARRQSDNTRKVDSLQMRDSIGLSKANQD